MTKERTKACKVCLSAFIPVRPLQAVCGPSCAMKKVRTDKKREREEIRQRKQAIKRIPDLTREAQKAFNAFIRERDKEQPCISCGKLPGDMTELHAGRDAGHYRSIGSASHLRFHEDNVHGQCVKCNQWKAGNVVEYRIRLIERIGQDKVTALEGDNEPRKWDRESLVNKKFKYIRKLKELKERE